jgi:CubicO group peptidase (beta-lactamase class C family)
MIRKQLAALLVLSVSAIALTVAVGKSSAQSSDDLAAKVDAIFAEREKPGMPGCALGVYRNGQLVYARGYGLANLEHNIPITSKTIFDIGSVSKQFTAASAVLLAQQGKISLEDDVRKYIPELRDFGTTITIRNLLNHTSGLRDYLTLFSLTGMDFDGVTGDDEALSIIVRQRALNFPPNTEWLYSNSGYFLISTIVKRASGKSLRAFASEHLFGPLGMKDTHFHDSHTEIVPLRATAYAPLPRDAGFRIDMSGFEQTGDGAVFTSVEDFVLWDRNFESKAVGGEGLISELLKRGKLNNGETLDYALGLVHANYKGLKLVEHGGSWAGYRAAYVRAPEERLSVACLCNFANANPGQYARRVLDVYLADLVQSADSNEAAKDPVLELPEATLKKWAGVYRNASTGALRRILLRDGKLRTDVFGPQSTVLAALAENRFRMVGPPVLISLSFAQGSGGSPARLTILREGERPETLEAVAPFSPSAVELPAFTGDFYSDELDVTWNLSMEENRLILRIGKTRARPLQPTFRDAFIGQGIQLIFARDAQGKAKAFTIQAGRVRNIRFERR